MLSSINPAFCPTILLPVCPSVRPSVFPPIYPINRPDQHPSICPSIIYLSIRPDLVFQVRWTSSSSGFQSQIKHLVGDVLLSAGFLSYAGPFNQEYRSLLLELWKREMEEKLIPFSPVRRQKNQQVENLSVCSKLKLSAAPQDLNVIGLLVDNATVSEWNLQGLPSDDLSIQNGIVVTKASRYPLLIDPQGQGKTWIQNRERDRQLQVKNLFLT